PCTASHCCCLHRHTLPCATFRSPHTAAASAPPLCHWTLDSRLPTLLLGGLFNIGLCMAFNLSCLRFATLPWAPVPPPLAAARSRVCVMGPCTASHCC
ncbi:unnamed protein product, partial [Staurois parvus]